MLLCVSLPQCWPFDSSWSWWKTKLLSTFEALLMTCTIFKLKNETFKDDINENHFLSCLWVSAPSSNLSSKFQIDDTAEVSSHLGFLQPQPDLPCFQCKYAFYILARYTDLQLQIFTYYSRISNTTAPILKSYFSSPTVYAGNLFWKFFLKKMLVPSTGRVPVWRVN